MLSLTFLVYKRETSEHRRVCMMSRMESAELGKDNVQHSWSREMWFLSHSINFFDRWRCSCIVVIITLKLWKNFLHFSLLPVSLFLLCHQIIHERLQPTHNSFIQSRNFHLKPAKRLENSLEWVSFFLLHSHNFSIFHFSTLSRSTQKTIPSLSNGHETSTSNQPISSWWQKLALIHEKKNWKCHSSNFLRLKFWRFVTFKDLKISTRDNRASTRKAKSLDETS